MKNENEIRIEIKNKIENDIELTIAENMILDYFFDFTNCIYSELIETYEIDNLFDEAEMYISENEEVILKLSEKYDYNSLIEYITKKIIEENRKEEKIMKSNIDLFLEDLEKNYYISETSKYWLNNNLRFINEDLTVSEIYEEIEKCDDVFIRSRKEIIDEDFDFTISNIPGYEMDTVYLFDELIEKLSFEDKKLLYIEYIGLSFDTESMAAMVYNFDEDELNEMFEKYMK